MSGQDNFYPEASDPAYPSNPFLRQPTDLHQTKQGETSRLAAPINLEGGLAITLNVEINPLDPSGITNPYKLLVPMLWHEGSVDQQRQQALQRQRQQKQEQYDEPQYQYQQVQQQHQEPPTRGELLYASRTPGPGQGPPILGLADSPERHVISPERSTPEREISPDPNVTPQPGFSPELHNNPALDPQYGAEPEYDYEERQGQSVSSEQVADKSSNKGWSKWLPVRRNRDTSDHPEYHPDTSSEDMEYQSQQIEARRRRQAANYHEYQVEQLAAAGRTGGGDGNEGDRDEADHVHMGNMIGNRTGLPPERYYKRHPAAARGEADSLDDGDEEIDAGLLPEEMIPHMHGAAHYQY